MDSINLMEASFTLKDVFYISGGLMYGTWRFFSVKKNQEINANKIADLENEIKTSKKTSKKEEETHERKHEAIRNEVMELSKELHGRVNSTNSSLGKEIHELSMGISKLNGYLEGLLDKDKES